MFEKLMTKFTEERNRMIDYCTEALINQTGINTPSNPTNFDSLMLYDELKRKNYKIKVSEKEDYIRIALIKLEDLYEDEIAWYDIMVKIDLTYAPKVSLVAISSSKKI